jgi:hypothetical protein
MRRIERAPPTSSRSRSAAASSTSSRATTTSPTRVPSTPGFWRPGPLKPLPVRPPPPRALGRALERFAFRPVTGGRSGAAVDRLERPGPEALFLETRPSWTTRTPASPCGPRPSASSGWPGGECPFPGSRPPRVERARVRARGRPAGSGRLGALPPREHPSVVAQPAEGCTGCTRCPAAGCPFDGRLEAKLEPGWWTWRTSTRSVAGARPPAVRRTAGARPADEDLVVCHGDYCLPNMLVATASRPGGRRPARVADPLPGPRPHDPQPRRELQPAVRSRMGRALPRALRPRARRPGQLEFYRLLDKYF